MSDATSVHRLPIDLPWPTLPVNAYLVEDEPLTLLDTGPNREDAMVALERALAAHRRRVEDLERVVLTHQHVDHVGLASEIVRRSGAELCALEELKPWLADQPTHVAEDRAFTAELMRSHGVPIDVIEPWLAAEGALDGWDPSVAVTRTLHDGDELAFTRRTWRAVHAPGHSPFDTLFHDEAHDELFTGDHLLPHISSNPVITVAREVDDGTPSRALLMQRESLRRTRLLSAATMHPGHGASCRDHRSLVRTRLREIDRRNARIAAVIAERPQTAYDVARTIWGETARAQPDLTLYEVLGHVDLLSGAKRAYQRPQAGVVMLSQSEFVNRTVD